MKKSKLALLLIAWLIGGTTSYFLKGFVARFYLSPYQALLFAFLAWVVIGLAIYVGVSKLPDLLQVRQLLQDWPFFLATIILARFVYKIIIISLPLLNRNEDPGKSGFSAYYLLLVFLTGVGIWYISKQEQFESVQQKISTSRGFAFLQNNARGFLLAGLFFIVYFVLAMAFNRQDFNTNNIFFAADTHSWRLRLTHPRGYIFGTRAVHPFPFLILRPVVALFSLPFAGDRYAGLLFLLALTGSANLFLAWIFIKKQAANANYAFLFAALMGISTVYLLFNSIAETYIFSSFLLVLFFVLLQKQRQGILGLVVNGVVIFGITVSNFAQTLVAMFLRGLEFKRTLRYGFFVLVICVFVSFANKLIYPGSALFFFNPSEYAVEGQYTINDINIDRFTRRFKLVRNEMFLYSVVAPRPYVSTTIGEARGEFPKFNFMSGSRLSRFVGFGRYAIWIWMGILAASVVMFAWQLWKQKNTIPNQLALALLLCLGFNFVFHIFYGFEPFLYSANWTYALLLFPAISLRSFAKSTIMQVTILLLIVLLTFNNQSFLYLLTNELAPYFLTSR